MKAARFLIVALTLLALAAMPSAAAPFRSDSLRNFTAGPCMSGEAYDPACDVNHDDQINITDIQLTAGHWNQSGTWVSDANHTHLGQTWTGANNPLKIEGSYGAPDYAALVLRNSVGEGLRVENTGGDGVRVGTATGDGVVVNSAGGDGVTVNSASGDGVYVGSADNSGVRVNSAGGDGVYVGSADNSGVRVNSAVGDGVFVDSVGSSGVRVSSAGDDGMYVYSAGRDGVLVNSAGGDGVFVDSAGTPSSHGYSESRNGFEVAGAEGTGLYVGHADGDGVLIRSAVDDGLQVGEDSSYPHYGIYIPNPGVPGIALWPNTSNVDGQWALYTADNIEAGNVFMSAQTLVTIVGGDQPLVAGDVVAAIGLADPIPGSLNRLARVQLATAEQANVVGVVACRMAFQPAPGKEGEPDMRSVDGPAQPGDYVAITVLGAAQVRVDAAARIEAGQRLTVAETPGHARALRMVQVEGVKVDESGPTLGVVLEALDKDDLVWVLVNPQ